MGERIDRILDIIFMYVITGILAAIGLFFGIIAFLMATCCLLGI